MRRSGGVCLGVRSVVRRRIERRVATICVWYETEYNAAGVAGTGRLKNGRTRQEEKTQKIMMLGVC